MYMVTFVIINVDSEGSTSHVHVHRLGNYLQLQLKGMQESYILILSIRHIIVYGITLSSGSYKKQNTASKY